MIAIVLGTLITNLDTVISLSGQANTTYNLIKTIGWVALTLDAIGILAVVGKWIMTVMT